MLRSKAGLLTLLCALAMGCSDTADPTPSAGENTPTLTQAPATDPPPTATAESTATQAPDTPEPTEPETPTAELTDTPEPTAADTPGEETDAPTAEPTADETAEPTEGGNTIDRDGDGYTFAEDCDDGDDEIHPGADEICDGIDNDCDEKIDDADDPVVDPTIWYLDSDSDGYGSTVFSVAQCSQPTGFVDNADDCDDTNAEVNPDTIWYLDSDDDGHGTDMATFQQCDPPSGFATQGDDCDDTNPDINPSAEEICNDIDDNCNGITDTDVPARTWYRDVDGDGYGNDDNTNTVGGCDLPFFSLEGGDCNDTNEAINPGADELCDEVDNDCDEAVDEGFDAECNPLDDVDGDGFSVDEGDCDDGDANTYPDAEEICDLADNDCDDEIDEGIECAEPTPRPGDNDGDGYTLDEGDCNDLDPNTYPGAEELCDFKDNDCDGVADDGLENCTLDPNGDYDNDGYSVDEGDCDDLDPTTHPNAEEICDLWDNDCDGQINEDLEDCIFDVDADYDDDGYGIFEGDCDDADPTTHPGADELCDFQDNDCDGDVDELPEGECEYGPDGDFDDDGVSVDEGDCDDFDPTTYPDADEVCDLQDNDCDGQADEDLNCEDPEPSDSDYDGDGYSIADGDCNDRDAAIHPEAEEICDGRDNNCDGNADEGLDDCDGSGDGDDDGYSVDDGDCHDADPDTYPGADEICDLKDNDCDGVADEDLDAYCDDIGEDESDRDEDGWTVTDGDCDDLDSSIYPDAPEECDRQDNDCDLAVDEGLEETCDEDLDVDGDGDGYSPNDGDCDDTDDTTSPQAGESCDLQDNDCDGEVDEDLGETCDYNDGVDDDRDEDGYTVADGDCDDLDASTHPGAEEICDLQDNNCDGVADEDLACENDPSTDHDGDGISVDDGDCDDTDPDTYPGADEICDVADNDCDGQADEGLEDCDYGDLSPVDKDDDGYTLSEGDCDDLDSQTHPDAPEICDQDDNDCDGVADEGLEECDNQSDTDNDGDGVSIDDGDCDDTDPDTYPEAEEVCDGADNDCDGQADEYLESECGYPIDYDRDDDSYTVEEGDCNDLNSATYPGADEICDQADNDCDGLADEGLEDCDYDPSEDHDGDGWSVDQGDCDDQNSETYPGAEESCDGIDNNCNGSADEGFEEGCTDTGGADLDDDGYTLDEGDCNDFDANQNPDAPEICDGIDNDCNGLADDGLEDCDTSVDGDGDGYSPDDGDCDDLDPDNHPEANEVCDGSDNDCDGLADEGLTYCGYEPDFDEDGDGHTQLEGDCDDTNSSIHPDADEICDLQDNDCDGLVDEGLDDCDTDPSQDHDGDGVSIEDGDCDDADVFTYPDADERCDDRDNDCDGLVDEGLESDCEGPIVDIDGDGYTVGEGDCNDTDGAIHPDAPELCDGIDNDCDLEVDETLESCDSGSFDNDDDGYIVDEGDCNDQDETVHPEAPELCDSKDNDCDGQVDEGLEDGCDPVDDEDIDQDGWTQAEGDCHDLDSSIYPGAEEVCDLVDNNCNGQVDEGLSPCDTDPLDDNDGDGYTIEEGDCDDLDPTIHPENDDGCDDRDNDCDGQIDEDDKPCDGNEDGGLDLDGDGYTVGEGDCNDLNANQYPGAEEVCDGRDNDCDGEADNIEGCENGDLDLDDDGYSINDGDCNDLDPAANPGAEEVCDNIDNNCDGVADEGLEGCNDEPDFDEDGDGYTVGEGDCNDLDPTVNPGAEEVCDLKDNDCDGDVDEPFDEDCEYNPRGDYDEDGYSVLEGDCNDADPTIHPGASDECDLKDNDCDGEVDEDIENCVYVDIGDQDGDGFAIIEGDCQDLDATVYPEAPELCDHKDNDCDGAIDEALGDTCDVDGDGYTVATGDCDESNPNTNPGADESCDLEDNDCDLIVDEGVASSCDYDNDGYPATEGDCNDNNPDINPDADEICDLRDNDCDDDVDEEVPEGCDYDGDGYSDEDGDCDNFDDDVYPGATDICDLTDNDCDDIVDEDFAAVCNPPDDLDNDGYSVDDGDCNDFSPEVYPGAAEICDLLDNDCDDEVDEGYPVGCAANADLDDDGYTITQGDCNDFDDEVYPEAEELCDKKNNDCDLAIDEGCDDLDDDYDNDGYTIDDGDCDDTNPDIHPDALEICDLRDNDCDGEIGDLEDNDGDGFVPCTGDCDDTDPDLNPAEDEVWYDGVDSDCNGDENPPACSDEPPIISVDIVPNCEVDLELIILDVCDGDCENEFEAVIELRNHGSQSSPSNVPISLYGISNDGFYTPLDTFSAPSVAPGVSSGAIRVDLGSFIALYPYASFALAIDDDGNGGETLAECDESNNLDIEHILSLDCPLPDPCILEPPGHPVPPNFECTYNPPAGQFTPILEWQRQSFASGGYNQIMAAPAIGNLTDDNRDGRIDERDIPDIVFTTFNGSSYGSTGYLRVISGDDGRELAATYGANGAAGVALGDTDADGIPEIYTVNVSGHLMRYDNNGNHVWTCPTVASKYNSPSIADIDGDGLAEILAGRTVCNTYGQPLYTTSLGHDSVVPFLLDVDQDGLMEVVSGAGVSNPDGTTRWVGPGGYGAMADFDGDSRPELVSVNRGHSTIYLTDDNGTRLWSTAIPGGRGGPPTIADYDGDGEPEVGVAGFDYYTVFETDGSILWARPVRDHSSSVTGSSVYDFDGDGAAEVVYSSEINLWVFKGATGEILLQEPNHASGTLWEYPLIADVDRDGHVEIVLASNNYAFSGWTGIAVLGDINNNWVTGRPVWNQHAYHITNVDDDLGIPRRQVANWIDGNNTFRQGGFGEGGALAAPDLVPVRIKTCPEECPNLSRVLFQIENWGINTVEPGLPWTIYGEKDGQRTALRTGYVSISIAPGFSSDTQEAEFDPGTVEIYDHLILVADDAGNGSGIQNECLEDNNELVLPPLCE